VTDDRLFPGWCATVLQAPEGCHSLTPGWRLDNVDISTEIVVLDALNIGKDPPVEDTCRNYSMVYADETTIFEVLDGVIVAQWWRGGRWPVESDL
jgi:hypothetical protein